MLRDSLARYADLMLHQQPSAELEECLAIPLTQLVQNHPSHRCSERFEDIGHLYAPQASHSLHVREHNRQVLTCLSS